MAENSDYNIFFQKIAIFARELKIVIMTLFFSQVNCHFCAENG
jgi:hypothetical protein